MRPLYKRRDERIEKNKAGYTAISCGQVGRGGNARFPTFRLDHYGPTDGQTDGRTDKVSYRIASHRLKTGVILFQFRRYQWCWVDEDHKEWDYCCFPGSSCLLNEGENGYFNHSCRSCKVNIESKSDQGREVTRRGSKWLCL